MKILIVEDEDLEHEGLSRMIRGMPLDISEILHAWNGIEALDVFARESPEILITDVRMPQMDGLALLQKLREMNQECEVLFISGYEDFHAVREAMLLGANNWLVKPVNANELYSMLCKLHVHKQHSDKSRNMSDEVLMLREKLMVFEHEDVLKRFLLCPPAQRGDDTETAGLLNLLSPDGQYIVMTADLVDIDQIYVSGAGLPEMSVEAVGPAYMPGGGMALVLFFPGIVHPQDIQSKAEDVSDAWKTYLEERCAAPVTVGVSMAGGSALLHVLYRQSVDALREQEVYGKGKVFFFYEDAATLSIAPRQMDLDDWVMLLQRDSFADLAAYMEQTIDLAAHEMSVHDSKQFFIKLIHTLAVQATLFPRWHAMTAGTLAQMDAIYNAQTLAGLLDTLQVILAEWRQIFSTERKCRNQEIVRDVLAIIEQDIAGDLYSETLAGKVYITASHLRRTFKNVMGMTLQDYVLRLRMEKAQALLRNTRLKVADIAKMTGYNSIPHFAMTFKAYTQMTPGDYRQRAGSRT